MILFMIWVAWVFLWFEWFLSWYRIKRKPPTWLFGTVLNPRSSSIRRYNRWLLISCVVGVAVDPLFLSVLAIHPQLACLYVQKGYALAVLLLRGLVDTMYLWHMWLQLKLAYVSKKSLFLGRGELVWDPRQIAWHYLRPLRRFWFDVFVILPVPQVSNLVSGYWVNDFRVSLLCSSSSRNCELNLWVEMMWWWICWLWLFSKLWETRWWCCSWCPTYWMKVDQQCG